MLTLAFCSYGLLAAGSLPPSPTAPLGGAPPSQGKGDTGHPHRVEEPGDGIPAREHTPPVVWEPARHSKEPLCPWRSSFSEPIGKYF